MTEDSCTTERAPVPVPGAWRRSTPIEATLLRWAAAGYENAQRDRVRYGEQLRAILQGRDAKWGCVALDDTEIARRLKEIRATGNGPVPVLGLLYARASEQEREMSRQMEALVEQHPAWPWLEDVKGIGTTLAARLLSRLDIARAPAPSSFWAYCGLATIPAEEFRCAECGHGAFAAPGTRLVKQHLMRGTGQRCAGAMQPIGTTPLVRVAQPRPRRGEQARYDLEAKTICYLIGVSFVRCGGAYREVYDERKAHLAAGHPDWPPKRVHLAAVRATVKRFLAELWVAWHEAGCTAIESHGIDHPAPGWRMVS